MINKIEDHKYTTGIGINLAPHLDIVKGIYSQGSGGTTPRLGITAEWVVSPHWSFETSLDYFTTKLTVNEHALHDDHNVIAQAIGPEPHGYFTKKKLYKQNQIQTIF